MSHLQMVMRILCMFLLNQFDRVLDKLQFEHRYHGRQMTEKFKGCHVFYDLVVEYMERLCSDNGWLCLCCKNQVLYHIFLPLNSYVLISLKHNEKVYFLDELLDWIHWKLDFT